MNPSQQAPAPSPVEFERLDGTTYRAALSLLAGQFDEHRIELTPDALDAAVHGLCSRPDRGAILIARQGGDPVGLAVLAYTFTLEHGGPVAWLDELYVVPALRGQGLGTRLLQLATETARAAGCLAIDLEVDTDHRRAQDLYLRHGFHRLPRSRFAKKLTA